MEGKQTLGFWDKVFNGSAEFNRFGVICMALTVAACAGGIAVGLGAIETIFQLTLAVVPTMTVLTLILGDQPLKWILSATTIALIIDAALIVFSLF